MNNNCLNVPVSYFRRVADVANPVTVNLLTFLRSDKYRASVERVRAEPDKDKRDHLKKSLLSGITPSGVFTYRHESKLVAHSGLLAGDLDFKDNPYSPDSIKAFVCGFVNVAYCALSASGQGIWFLVPIVQPNYHKEHFAALLELFAIEGLHLDRAPANVASFRYCSFDPAAYYNPNAVPFTGRKVEHTDVCVRPTTTPTVAHSNAAKVEAVLRQIEAHRTDITDGYSNWVKIGLSLAAEFGEAGRDYFHRISQYHPQYSTGKTDAQYTKCLRYGANRLTLDYFLGRAKVNGLLYARLM